MIFSQFFNLEHNDGYLTIKYTLGNWSGLWIDKNKELD